MRPIAIPHVHAVGVECPACAISPASRPTVMRGGGDEIDDLPCLALDDEAAADWPFGSCPVMTRWELTTEEREAIALGAPIDVVQLTYGHPYQAISIEIPGRAVVEIYRPARWIEDFINDGARFLPAGVYDDESLLAPREWPVGSFFLPYSSVASLIPLLEERRLLLPRLDERLRVEDLRITHRLLDLLEQVSPGEPRGRP